MFFLSQNLEGSYDKHYTTNENIYQVFGLPLFLLKLSKR